ncbi:MAG: hypothetical protein NZ992_07755 [Candidatus Korarchaeum sp.]|nr:hypothetical protein [Candidatus Korarchaeum sp.]MDW8034961.1 hypothetical protein [Candidatus Korarchaeum sp.]
MLEVLLCLASGFLAAKLLKLRVNRLFRPLAYTLIFLIGLRVSSGSVTSLAEVLLQSLAITLSTLLGSILALQAFRRLK